MTTIYDTLKKGLVSKGVAQIILKKSNFLTPTINFFALYANAPSSQLLSLILGVTTWTAVLF